MLLGVAVLPTAYKAYSFASVHISIVFLMLKENKAVGVENTYTIFVVNATKMVYYFFTSIEKYNRSGAARALVTVSNHVKNND
ncbi:hypothetical protein BBD42_25720 [Paenibacillus sp. BIHB 4019]|uniref:Uncharacterized protein n=1 Tax=Paenibacillus sp. BIHB 4019 TaxID=1870819 RepID=A0A1B2DP74_9BACL|nr:hypothetical protein [Paenibacillus sp. BIHB 4019]ANY69502.1 hypothetical protein BBD42_25720 [Paenibacillus sp. BIHB 4019]